MIVEQSVEIPPPLPYDYTDVMGRPVAPRMKYLGQLLQDGCFTVIRLHKKRSLHNRSRDGSYL